MNLQKQKMQNFWVFHSKSHIASQTERTEKQLEKEPTGITGCGQDLNFMNIRSWCHCTQGEMSLKKVAKAANPKWGHKNVEMDNNKKLGQKERKHLIGSQRIQLWSLWESECPRPWAFHKLFLLKLIMQHSIKKVTTLQPYEHGRVIDLASGGKLLL